MSDTRFDGKRVFTYDDASRALYEVRGNFIYEVGRNHPLYEIRGDLIHKANSKRQPVYEIRGHHIHKHMRAITLYVIR